MNTTSSPINLLPLQILEKAFTYLTAKRDLKTCRLVSRAWYHAVTDIHFQLDFRIRVSSATLQNLINDASQYDTFGPKITSIIMDERRVFDKSTTTGADAVFKFRTVLMLCPNLYEVNFNDDNITSEYLVVLLSYPISVHLLPKIKKIKVNYFEDNPPKIVRLLYLETAIKFKETLTYLEIFNTKINYISSLETCKLVEIVSHFPKLKHLVVRSGDVLYRENNIDLAKLLNSTTSTALEQLTLCNIKFNLSTVVKKNMFITGPEKRLKSLQLKVGIMNTNTLNYIMHHLINLESLHIEVRGAVYCDCCSIIAEYNSKLFQQFVRFCGTLESSYMTVNGFPLRFWMDKNIDSFLLLQ